MASSASDGYAEDALSKLLQMGKVAEYHNEFEMLINRVTRISESLLKSFYIVGLKVALRIELLRVRPTTLAKAFSLAHITEACFEDERSPTTIAKPNDLNIGIRKSASFPLWENIGIGDILELLDNGGSHNSAQPNVGTESEVVSGLPEEFQKEDMVDALSRVVQQKS
nr:retrovirus-related Pol polyprotein from transposon TNT 1-94 [Tanacetum cinerariifolium]